MTTEEYTLQPKEYCHSCAPEELIAVRVEPDSDPTKILSVDPL
jgi:hypothetical protein